MRTRRFADGRVEGRGSRRRQASSFRASCIARRPHAHKCTCARNGPRVEDLPRQRRSIHTLVPSSYVSVSSRLFSVSSQLLRGAHRAAHPQRRASGGRGPLQRMVPWCAARWTRTYAGAVLGGRGGDGGGTSLTRTGGGASTWTQQGSRRRTRRVAAAARCFLFLCSCSVRVPVLDARARPSGIRVSGRRDLPPSATGCHTYMDDQIGRAPCAVRHVAWVLDVDDRRRNFGRKEGWRVTRGEKWKKRRQRRRKPKYLDCGVREKRMRAQKHGLICRSGRDSWMSCSMFYVVCGGDLWGSRLVGTGQCVGRHDVDVAGCPKLPLSATRQYMSARREQGPRYAASSVYH